MPVDTDEEHLLYFEAHQINARALFLGSRIDVWEFERADTLSTNPLTIQAGHTGYAVLLRFGVIVLIGLSALEEAAFLRTLAPFVSNRFENPESEETDIVIDSTKQERINSNGALVLHEASQERLQVVATVLAKSVVLAHYETQVNDVFTRVEQMADKMSQGRIPARGKDLLREIGNVLTIQTWTVGRVQVTEKPEITWDSIELDRLYERLAYEYELRDRDLALNRKLEIISRTAESFLELQNSRQSLRLEWYIVILILVEVVLIVYDIIQVH